MPCLPRVAILLFVVFAAFAAGAVLAANYEANQRS